MRTSLRQYVLHNHPSPAALRARLAAAARAIRDGRAAGDRQPVPTPDEILVDEEGRVSLKRGRPGEPIRSAFLDRDPEVYLPPECIRGQARSPAADVYSLAAACWEAFAGRLPFDIDYLEPGEALAVLEEFPAAGIGPPAGMDEKLERVLRAALSPNPAARPGIEELAAALEPAGTGRPRRILVGVVCLIAAAVCLALAAKGLLEYL